MAQPLVTVVTPSYNQGAFIRATIESVLSQDYPRLEYIIMDGGSTDETAQIVKEYASRLTWISEKDRGQAHAINKGFRIAKGEIISWLNSDDFYLPGAVSHAVEALEQAPEAGAVYGEGYLIDKDGQVTGRFPCTEPFNLWKLVYLSDYILQQTVFFRKAVIDELGYLNEDLHYTLDWDILIRIGQRYPLQYISEYMGCLREYPQAKSFSGGAPRIREIGAMLRSHTGMRYPPGYFVYGLDTYTQIWCSYIDRLAPAWLGPASRFLKRAVRFAAGTYIGRTIRESQGWYSDGWATTRARFMLPRNSRGFSVQGTLPDHRDLAGQRLQVYCNGALLEETRLAFGDFELSVPGVQPVPCAPLHVELRASRYFVPRWNGRS